MNKKGFTLLEMLCSLFCFTLILQLLYFSYVKLYKVKDFSTDIQDIISVNQLIHIFNLSEILTYSESVIHFYYLNEIRMLSLINNKIILSPGTIIYFLNVDSIKFEIEDSLIYLTYTRNNNQRKVIIGYL